MSAATAFIESPFATGFLHCVNESVHSLLNNSEFYQLELADYFASSLLHGTFLLTGPLIVTAILVHLEIYGLRNNILNMFFLVFLLVGVAGTLLSSTSTIVALTLDDLYRTLFALLIIAVSDLVIRGVCRISTKTGWFTLHAFANLLIVIWSFQPTIFVLLNPYRSYESPEPTQNFAHFIMLSLHIYHIIAYNTNLMDLIHHLVSAGLIGGIALAWRFGSIVPAVDFFMSGLPGGIDYALLALSSGKVIDSIYEKKINRWLNFAIRAPGLFYVLNAALLGKIHSPLENLPSWPILVLCGSFHGANALYFQQRVAWNTAVTVSTRDRANAKRD